MFHTDECSKSAVGSYSPEFPQKAADIAEDVLSEKEEEEEEQDDSSSDDEAQALAVEKSVERILDIVNSAAKKKMDQRDRKKASRQQQAQDHRAEEATAAASSESNTDSPSSTFDNYGGDEGDYHDAETDTSAQGHGSQKSVDATVRGLVEARILTILNTGTYEEVSTEWTPRNWLCCDLCAAGHHTSQSQQLCWVWYIIIASLTWSATVKG